MSNSYKVSKAATLISIISEYYTHNGKRVDYTVDTNSDYLTFKIADEYGNSVTHRINLNSKELTFAIAVIAFQDIDSKFFEFYQDMSLREEN